MTVRFSTWIDSLVPAATSLASTDKVAVITDAPDTRAISRDDLAAAIYATVMTTDGDLITRSGGVPTRLTRSGLASDTAFTSKYIQSSLVDSKGDLIVGTADNTVARIVVGTNGHALIADSAETGGMKWAAVGDVTLTGIQTLTNKTLTAPVISSISNSGTVTIPAGTDTLVGRATTDTLTNKTLTSPTITGGLSSSVVSRTAEERWNIVASAATGTINIDALTASIWSYTSDALANWTLHFRGSSDVSLGSMLAVGDSITLVFVAKIGSTQRRPTAFQIDGNAITPLWQGGSAPTSGNVDSTDMYVFTIVKTSDTPSVTYSVYASQTQFKA